MSVTGEDEQKIDQAFQVWRQGDASLDADSEFLHFADLSRPHSSASAQVAALLAADGEAIEAGATAVLDEVRAAPSWNSGEVQLGWRFIWDADPVGAQVDCKLFLITGLRGSIRRAASGSRRPLLAALTA